MAATSGTARASQPALFTTRKSLRAVPFVSRWLRRGPVQTIPQAKSLITSLQVVVRSNDDNIHDTIENIQVATENLDQLTDQVKQRPWSLIRIRQPKDRKVPQ
jgi:hypothetical protein